MTLIISLVFALLFIQSVKSESLIKKLYKSVKSQMPEYSVLKHVNLKYGEKDFEVELMVITDKCVYIIDPYKIKGSLKHLENSELLAEKHIKLLKKDFAFHKKIKNITKEIEITKEYLQESYNINNIDSVILLNPECKVDYEDEDIFNTVSDLKKYIKEKDKTFKENVKNIERLVK